MKLKCLVPILALGLITACEFNGDIWKEINAKFDGTPPASFTLAPAEVGSTTPIVLTFNEEIDPSSVNKTSIQVLQDGTAFTDYSLSVDGNVVTITPTGYYSRTASTNVVRVSPPLSDPYRNEIAAALPDASFTVAGAPYIVTTIPNNGYTDVYPQNWIQLVFNEAMDSAVTGSINLSGVYTAVTSSSGTWSNSRIVTVPVGAYIPYATTSTAQSMVISGYAAPDGTAMTSSTINFDMLEAWKEIDSVTAATHVSGSSSYALLTAGTNLYLVYISASGDITVRLATYVSTGSSVTFADFGSSISNADTSYGISAGIVPNGGSAGGDLIVVAYQDGTDYSINVGRIDSSTANSVDTGLLNAANVRFATNQNNLFYIAYNDTSTSESCMYYASSPASTTWTSTLLSSSGIYPIDLTYINPSFLLNKGSATTTLTSYRHNSTFAADFTTTIGSGTVTNLKSYYFAPTATTYLGATNSSTLYTYRYNAGSWTSTGSYSGVTSAEFDVFTAYVSSSAINYAAIINSGIPYLLRYSSSTWSAYTNTTIPQDLSQITTSGSVVNIKALEAPFDDSLIAAYQTGAAVTVVRHR